MSAIPDPAYALRPSGNLRRRELTSRLVVGSMVTAAALAVAVLFILVYYAAKRGIGQLSPSFFTSTLPPYNGVGGGVGPALAGTAEMVAIASLIAVPVGVLTAIYLAEFAHPLIARPVQTVIEIMAGLPTVIAGIFIAGLVVNRFGQSAIAGGLALSIVEVPLIARASLESVRRVPHPLREAADALGVAHWRTVLGVILPTASSGIVTATILAVARAAGETAPLLFTTNDFGLNYQADPRHAVAGAPLEIWQLLESGYTAAVSKAWGLAFLLMFAILLANIGARLWLRRSERKRGL
ncbi:MAG: phosphate ABC transporter permease PstA [Acidobacteriota bacterium]|nr:phosphate ABC transporter permease PstA [Acidobacteriota bacterium]